MLNRVTFRSALNLDGFVTKMAGCLSRGRRVRYDTGSFQLHVGDLEKYQQTISLDEHKARFFDPEQGRLPDFDTVDQFWTEVVGR